MLKIFSRRRGGSQIAFLAIASLAVLIGPQARAAKNGAGAAAAAETLTYTITRNGEPIGTQKMVIKHAGPATSVDVTTDLAVKVMFVTAYRFAHKDQERWVGGRLVALDSSTDNNGARHSVAVTRNKTGLKIDADGKVKLTSFDGAVATASFWTPALLRRKAVLDTQDGRVDALSVLDHGIETIDGGSHPVSAHHYTIRSRYSEDVWYDEKGRLTRVKLIAPQDNSVILYQLDQLA